MPLPIREPAGALKAAVMPCRGEGMDIDPALGRLGVAGRVLTLRSCDLAIGVNTGDDVAVELALVIPLIYRAGLVSDPPNHGNAFDAVPQLAKPHAQVLGNVPAAAGIQLHRT